MHLLIVEDDPFMLALYRRFFKDQSCATSYAESNTAARLCLKQLEHLDAVILDNQLGNELGTEILADIKLYFPYAAILMISAGCEAAAINQAFQDGIDDYLLKPINYELLWIKLQHSIASRALQKSHDQQQTELSRWVEQALYEQQLANHVFHSLSGQLTQAAAGLSVYRRSSAAFSGDILIHREAPDGSWYILLADSMGHGLAAAISLLPVLEVFADMVQKGRPLSNLVLALNARLSQQLPPDRFVAALVLRLDAYHQTLEVWNGGMPELILTDIKGMPVEVAASEHMPLGILAETAIDLQCQTFSLANIQHLIGFTDGVTDSTSLDGSQLSPQQIVDCWQDGGGFNELSQRLDAISTPADDMTLFHLELAHWTSKTEPVERYHWAGSVNLTCQLSGTLLAHFDQLPDLIQWFSALGLPQDLSQRTFIALNELYLNALEHGVMQLDSAQKHQPDGFVGYYQTKANKASLLLGADQVLFQLDWTPDQGRMQITLQDTGPGFNATAVRADDSPSDACYGRGIPMLRQLCSELRYNEQGNAVVAVLHSR